MRCAYPALTATRVPPCSWLLNIPMTGDRERFSHVTGFCAVVESERRAGGARRCGRTVSPRMTAYRGTVTTAGQQMPHWSESSRTAARRNLLPQRCTVTV